MNPLPFAALTCLLVQALASRAAEPPNAVDHAGIIQSLDAASFDRGKVIYENLCTNCHGADGVTPPLPTARAFGKGQLKFGSDPYSMFKTLTEGNGQMAPQTWMTPRERYEVIHYIRGKFMRPMRDDFVEINDGYLEELPTVNVAVKEEDKKERDFGPALASQLGRDISNVLSIKLGDDTTISYNLHTLDQAGLWEGGFLNLQATQHYRERGGGVAERQGEDIEGLAGWAWAHDSAFDYPTGNLKPRGPLPERWLDYRGHYLHGDRVVLSYAIDGRDVLESPHKPSGYGAIEHTLRVAPGDTLKLSVAKLGDDLVPATGFLSAGDTSAELRAAGEIAVMALSDGASPGRFVAASVVGSPDRPVWSFDEGNRLVLTIPASGDRREFQIVRFAGTGEAELLAFATYVASKPKPAPLANLLKGGDLRWPGELTSRGELGDDSHAYALDTLGLPPADNPWNVWFRTSALAFSPDGRMAVSTHGGDVWIVSGIDRGLGQLRWKRFAAGMYEPFGMQVIDGLVYVTCKDRIVRLHDYNGDGEADFYESFSADDDVSTFFHAFNFDLQRDTEGNLYYAKSGQYTDYALAGSVIKVSPDGKRREVYCTGFRTPNGMGMMPDGRPTVSDNQGNWMPASKISLCEQGGFYGYVQTHAKKPNWAPDGGALDHTKVEPPKTFDQPIIWMPQDYDNSSGGQLWVDDHRWGPLSGKLLHTSFGKGWLYYMMVQEVDGVAQSAIVKLDLDADTGIQRARVNPADGQVYAVGLNGWNGNGRKGLAQGGIHRFRYTGTPSKLLTGCEVTPEGVRLDFNFSLARSSASPGRFRIEQWNYLWASRYGSKQFSLANPWEPGRDKVVASDVTISDDGRSAHLAIPEIQPVNQMRIVLDVEADDGGALQEEVYLTINKVPGKEPDMKALTVGRAKLWGER